MTSRPPLLLVHGYGDTGAIFDRLRTRLARDGRPVYTFDLQPNNARQGLEPLAQQVKDWVAQNLPEGPLDLVGLSMGGLVSRYWLQRLGGLERCRRFVSLSSPHRGTWTAFVPQHRGARQMRPGSDFLRDLNRDAHRLAEVDFCSLWTPLDLMILPARSSVLPGLPDRRLWVLWHGRMARSARVAAWLDDYLDRP